MHLMRLRFVWWINRQLQRLNFNQRLRYPGCGGFWFDANHGSQIGFVFGYQHGRGAGYIGGWTIYLAINSGSRSWQIRNRARRWFSPLEIGWTLNANRIPYAER